MQFATPPQRYPHGYSLRAALTALGVAGLTSLGLAPQAQGQTASPERTIPITWLVGYAPGGSVDVLTRGVAQQLSRLANQTVVVENRAGGSGVLALQLAAKATADGNTLVTVPGPLLQANPGPEVGRELRAVAMLAEGPMVLVAPANSAPADLAALIRTMQANPKAWSYASSGNGTSQHLAGELLNASAGTAAVHVPYKGGGQAVTDVLAGQIPLAMLGAAPVIPHIQSGKLKAYGITTARRLELLPNVPTFREAGLPGYEATQWFAVAAPAATAAARVAQLNGWIATALDEPTVRELVRKSGNVKGSGTPQEVEAFLRRDTEAWRALAVKAKLALD